MINIWKIGFCFFLTITGIGTIAQTSQINIPRIEAMSNEPSPYNLLNWKKIAQQYDSFVYNVNLSGLYLPLVSVGKDGINYPENKTIRMHTYVGTNSPNGSEGINVLPSLVSASLNGIDKSNQFGQDWLTMSQDFFNKANGENIYLNNAGSGSGSDWWYDVMPNVFFYQLFDLYKNHSTETIYQFNTVANQFFSSVKAMEANDAPWTIPNMNYRAWNFKTMKGNANGVKEPEAAGGYAWILYNAYRQTGKKDYLKGAEWALEFLSNYQGNPSYELQLPYGTLTAAKMNAEIGTRYNIEKMVNWSFDKGPLRNWGTIVGRWGSFDVSGLVGEANDKGNDYAFQLNGLHQAAALLPMVRYDKRFARAIGKWILNLANATRLFYPGYLPEQLQDASAWSAKYDPGHVIGYEALRQKLNGLSPVSTGDALGGGWAATNLSLYSTSSIGYLGAIVETTNVEKILKLDLLKTDFFHDKAYPSYLLFNPFNSSQTVEINVGTTKVDIYESISERFIATNVSDLTSILIPANQAVMIVLAPVNAAPIYQSNKFMLNDIVVDYNQSKINYTKPVRIKSLAVNSKTVQLQDTISVYATAEDPDILVPGGKIYYEWKASSGVILGNGNTVRWYAADSLSTSTIQVVAIDDQGHRDSAWIEILVVSKINLAPQISKINKSATYQSTGKPILLDCIATDPNGDSLSYTWTANGGTFSSANTKSVIWTAPDNEAIYTIAVKVNDNGNLSDAITTSILVRNFTDSPEKLIAWYPFENNSYDKTVNQLHGEASGVVYVPDRNGKELSAAYFNGGAQHILVKNDPKLNVQDAISVSCWLNAVRLPEKETFILSHGSWQNRWKLSITPDKKIRWTINSLSSISDLDSPFGLQVDSIYHLTASYDGSIMTLYINGELIAYKALTGKIRSTSLPLLIGQMLPDNAEYNFKGIIDEVKLFENAVSPAKASAMYQSGITAYKRHIGDHLSDFKIYPNPAKDRLSLQLPVGFVLPARVAIYNINGQLVWQSVLNSYSSSITISSFNTGIYFIQLSNHQQFSTTIFSKT